MSGNKMNSSPSNSESIILIKLDYSSENEEGGFHNSKIGDTFKNQQYRVVNLLGKGTFSQVWLVQDTVSRQHLALKISSSKKSQIEAAEDEIEILIKLKDSKQSKAWEDMQTELNCKNNHVVDIVDHFLHEEDYGSHQCSTLELLGPTLLDIIEYYDSQNKTMNIELVKHIVKQILIGLCYMHDICKVIHTDIKPENIMIILDENQDKKLIEKLTNGQIEEPELQKKVKVNGNCDVFTWLDCVPIKLDTSLCIKIVDFGNACFENQQFEEIQTREYKSPESLLQAPYFPNTDVWSLACLTFELLTNNYLFRPSGENEVVKVEDHLAMIIETIGPIPKQLLHDGKRSKLFFNSQGKLRSFDDLEYMALCKILVNEYSIKEQDAIQIEEFLVFLLKWEPKNRPSAQQVLKHKWLNN